jgi:NAD(P)-dependent dehydrogenase (short-subunit alcohol dehydrogenase family)
MDLGLSGRTALVTGASKGIGFACAWSLAREGCHVHLAARSSADLEQARARIAASFGVAVEVHPVDLSIGDNARALIESCRDVDILVNNAGAIPGGSIQAIEEARWREAWDLKVFGYINTCRAALANMRARGRGVIINVIGAAGERPSAGYIAGAGGNAALMAMTRALGASSSRFGVRVVGINPGLIETDRLVALARGRAQAQLGDPERWRETLDPDFPPGQPAHIGDMVAFLASDLSSNTTGTIITIDGGASARSS